MTATPSKNQPDAGSLPPQQGAERPRTGRAWFVAALLVIVLVLLLVFILENSHQVDISFFGAHSHWPLGVALLLAAVLGMLVIVIAGTVRKVTRNKR